MTKLKSPSRSRGFSLIELMVVVAIIAIIAAVAIPTYQAQIRESRRTDAKTAVLDLAGREEKYFSLNNAYTGSPANLGYAAAGSAAVFPQPTGSGYYQVFVCPSSTTGGQVTVAACTATGSANGTAYVIAAVPVAGTSQVKDTQCQYFAVDNTGTQFANSSQSVSGAGTTATCWH